MIAKRCFFIYSILYIYRGISFFVTVLPISSSTYYCSPRSNSTSASEIVNRALSIYSGMGLSLSHPMVYCGDSIFSGHATTLVFCYLVLKECKLINLPNEFLMISSFSVLDTPNKLKFLQVLALLNAIVGILFLLISHSHYTIDVIIAYYLTTRLFWIYHQLCLSSNPTNKTHLAKEWWMFLFNYFETYSNRTISNEFQLPWPFNVKCITNTNKV